MEDLGLDKKIILEWFLKRMGVCGPHTTGSECGSVPVFFGHSNESLCSIKGGEFHD
jgi:hypothetical protein